jgi:predicted dehydrogenase
MSHSIVANRRPVIKLLNKDGSVAVQNYHKTAEDTIMLHGQMSNDAPLSLTLRGGKPFKGTPGMDWRIYCEKGEIRATASGPFLQIGYPDMEVSVHDLEKDEVEIVKIERDEFEDLPMPARNVAKVYEAIARGDEGDGLLCDFQDAVERHRFLEMMSR